VKASEFGATDLMNEFDHEHQRDGGYVEPSRIAAFWAWLRDDDREPLEVTTDPAVAEVKVDDHHH